LSYPKYQLKFQRTPQLVVGAVVANAEVILLAGPEGLQMGQMLHHHRRHQPMQHLREELDAV
jgi:hypothetical protein